MNVLELFVVLLALGVCLVRLATVTPRNWDRVKLPLLGLCILAAHLILEVLK